MAKYRLLRERLGRELPGIEHLEAPRASDGELALAHSPAYVAAVDGGTLSAAEQREIGFPWSPEMVERSRRSAGATVAAVAQAMQEGLSANLAGGTHHAYVDKGGGFCVFNDAAVAARVAQMVWARTHRMPLQVAVIDLDVHQGNGTARIFQNDASVYTLSIHGDKNFPFRKEASDLDIALADGSGDDDYLVALDQALQTLSESFQPGLVIYLAGADPHEGDRLGRLKLSHDGLEARDRRVLDWCYQRHIPLAMAMAGGYGVDINNTVQAQVNTYRVALHYWQRWQNRRATTSPSSL